MAARFTARFDSDCNSCGDRITEGDEAGYVDDEVCCELCCDYSEES
jgi:hypothetical protein